MKVLFIHHPLHPDPNSGGGLRVLHLSEGLQYHVPNLQILHVSKIDFELHNDREYTQTQASQNSLNPNSWQSHLHQSINYHQPDVVLCGQLEDAALLKDVDIPLIIDLYAPRLLELAYDTQDTHTVCDILLALQKGDAFLISHPLQEPHWMAIFALAGLDIQQTPCIVTPLAVEVPKKSPATKNTSNRSIFIGGGRIWPWQNPLPNLQNLLHVLDDLNFGEVHWFQSPNQTNFPIQHPRLHLKEWTTRKAYRQALQQAHFALDLNPPSPERSLACAFRHMEYIGCNLPILCWNHNTLTQTYPQITRFVNDKNIKEVLQRLGSFKKDAAKALQQFQKDHHPHNNVLGLLEFLQNPKTLSHPNNRLMDLAQTDHNMREYQDKIQKLEFQIQQLQQEKEGKNTLIALLNAQLQSHTSSMLQLAQSIENISSFKNNIAQVMGDALHQQRDSNQNLQDEIALLKADNAKKSAELTAMDQLRARLENDLQAVRLELQDSRQKQRSFLSNPFQHRKK